MFFTITIFFLFILFVFGIKQYLQIKQFFWIKKRFFNSFILHIPNIFWESEEQYYLNKYIQKDDIVLQLGGNVGTSCILVDRLVSNKKQQICVEPNLQVVKLLKENKRTNKSKFQIIDAVITNKQNIYLNENNGIDDIDFTTTDKNTGKLLKTLPLSSLGEFNVLFADCEGCLVDFIKEHNYILKKINKIIYEKDNEKKVCYDEIERMFLESGFIQVEYGFICVWIKPYM